jgi:hypothetical protein
MTRTTAMVRAAIVIGLLACASNARAAIVYFDAQILDISTGKTVVLKNTVICDPSTADCATTDFSATPNPDPLGAGNNGSNWTQNAGQPVRGTDGLWNQRFATPAPGNFGNPDASGNGTIYESRGNSGGPNSENLPVLKTTINVPLADQGTTRGVYALFWVDTSSWRIAACLECVNDDTKMPIYNGGGHTPTGYVFGVYDVGAGDPGNLSPQDVEMNGYTTSDAMPGGTGGTGRRLKAAWLGNVVLDSTLTVFVGDGPPLTAAELAGNGGANSRTWYDGIAFGDVQNLEPLACIPEPTSLVLLSIVGVTSLGMFRRRL